MDRTWLLIVDGNVGWERGRKAIGARGFCLFPVTGGCAIPEVKSTERQKTGSGGKSAAHVHT